MHAQTLHTYAARWAGARTEVLDGLGPGWMVQNPVRGAAALTRFCAARRPDRSTCPTLRRNSSSPLLMLSGDDRPYVVCESFRIGRGTSRNVRSLEPQRLSRLRQMAKYFRRSVRTP